MAVNGHYATVCPRCSISAPFLKILDPPLVITWTFVWLMRCMLVHRLFGNPTQQDQNCLNNTRMRTNDRQLELADVTAAVFAHFLPSDWRSAVTSGEWSRTRSIIDDDNPKTTTIKCNSCCRRHHIESARVDAATRPWKTSRGRLYAPVGHVVLNGRLRLASSVVCYDSVRRRP